MDESAFHMPIDGTLDLHTFSPKEVKSLVPAYIDECLAQKIFQLRIIHGKGTGALRRIVQAALDRHPAVSSYRHEGGSGGSWGATVVDLKEADL
jgi:dsDNA-specific endonuclease/ATPase MutS2